MDRVTGNKEIKLITFKKKFVMFFKRGVIYILLFFNLGKIDGCSSLTLSKLFFDWGFCFTTIRYF